MSADLIRAQALIRDEQRHRRALDRVRADRYDVAAAQQLRRSMNGLLETLGFVASDPEFWDTLRFRADELSDEQITALSWFDDRTFGGLLSACGYHAPPPPPIEDLIADTRQAIAFAVMEGPGPAQISEARRQLSVFLYRTRRQLENVENLTSAEETGALGRRVGRVARKIIPAAVGLAAAAAVETAFPAGLGTATGFALNSFVSHALDKSGKQGIEFLAERAAGWGTAALVGETLQEPLAVAHYYEQNHDPLSPTQAVEAHLGEVLLELHAAADKHAISMDRELVTASSHLSRVIELARDHALSESLVGAATLASEVIAAVRAGGAHRHELARASEAAHLALQVTSDDGWPPDDAAARRPFAATTSHSDARSPWLGELEHQRRDWHDLRPTPPFMVGNCVCRPCSGDWTLADS